MARILVTGSAGLVGRALCAALEADGHQVVPFDLFDVDRPRDMRNAADLSAAVAGCRGIFHLAAVSRVAWGEEAPALCDTINTGCTDRLIVLAERQTVPPWLVFTSSREVYGNPARLPVREGDARQPVNVYGRSKLAGEQLIEAAQARGLRAAIIRLSNVYGTEFDHPDRAVPSLLWRAMAGQPLSLTGPGAFFDFVHVRDCVDGLLRAGAALDGGAALPALHLVTGRRTSLHDLAEAAIAECKSASPIRARPERPFDVSGFVGDPDLAQRVLGFRTRISLETGLAELRDILRRRGSPPGPARRPDPMPAAS